MKKKKVEKTKKQMTDRAKKWLLENNVNYRIYDVINTYGVKETRSLLENFLGGGCDGLGDDEGFIVSMFIGYYNLSDLEDELAIINMFIGYTQYKWEKTKESLWWLEDGEDEGEGTQPRTRFKKFSEL